MVEKTNLLGQIVRHLQKLQRELERNEITAVLEDPGGSRLRLHVPGIDGPITCRSNPQDAHHLWFWHVNEPLTPAGDAAQAREAVTKISELLTEAENESGPARSAHTRAAPNTGSTSEPSMPLSP